jgi:hypothetical protein
MSEVFSTPRVRLALRGGRRLALAHPSAPVGRVLALLGLPDELLTDDA